MKSGVFFKGSGFLSRDLINIQREVIMLKLLETGVMNEVPAGSLMIWFLHRCSLFWIRALLSLVHMARQGVNTLVLVLCCIELVLSPSSNPVSTLDPFSVIDDDYSDGEADHSELATQDNGQLMNSKLAVYCNNDTMKVILPAGSLSQVKILGK